MHAINFLTHPSALPALGSFFRAVAGLGAPAPLPPKMGSFFRVTPDAGLLRNW
ncbi:MAG TPA: hypothetical protein VK776_20925 [Bryobacteraceae bacterium]|nr:hypothetical protein [Bryobacteraceae bacterium]